MYGKKNIIAKGSRKKRSFLVARPLRGGKNNVFEALKKSGRSFVATKLEGGGWGKALVAGPVKNTVFLRLP